MDERGRWLLESAIAGVARQSKSRALVVVVDSPEIRQKHFWTDSLTGRVCIGKLMPADLLS